MRHNFVNDIGDYAKYALLRALCAADEDIRLGVIWYLTEHVERNGDGRKRGHLSQSDWDQLDPALLSAMRGIEAASDESGLLNLSLIEAARILPAGTAYFAEAMPAASVPAKRRGQERAAWFTRALAAMDGCGLVFLDPDNGLAVRSVPLSAPMADKYATAAEVAALLRAGAAVVLYQHGNRTPWREQRQRVCAQLASAADRPVTIRTVRFGAFGVRAFFCVSTDPRHSDIVDRGLAIIDVRIRGWAKASYLQIE